MDNQTAGLDLDRLEALARAVAEHSDAIGIEEWHTVDGELNLLMPRPDVELISACSPVAVLQLIDLARRAEPSVAAGDKRPRSIVTSKEFHRVLASYVDGVAGQWELIACIDSWARAALASPAVSQMDGAAYSAPFTTDVPQCCEDPENCAEPCTPAATAASLSGDLADLEARQRVAVALGLGRSIKASFAWEYLLGVIEEMAEADDSRTQAPSRDVIEQAWKFGLHADHHGYADLRAALAKQGASHAADSGKADEKLLADSLNMMMWLYRRLPVAYGKPPFVDAAIMRLGERLGCDDVPIAIRERAAIASSAAQEAK
jgi:hypothetical protein